MSKKEKKLKTNVARIIEKHGADCNILVYGSPEDDPIDGVTAAKLIGIDESRCFKTLVTENLTHQNFVFVIPVAESLDMKKAAKHFHEKRIEMLPSGEIEKVTGYHRGGCSPIGMRKNFPTAIDETALKFETISVSAGVIGAQIELDPRKLARISAADFADLTKDTGNR